MGKAKYYRRPDGLYETIRTINGKRKAFRGHSCREVDKKILEYREEAAKGRRVSAIADEWQNLKEREVGRATRISYSAAIKRLKSEIGGEYVTDVRPANIRKIISDYARKGYSKSTVSTYLTVIKQVFSYSVLCGEIEYNPAAEVTIPKTAPTADRPALTAEQEEKAKAYKDGEAGLYGQILLYTGLRRGELSALEWQDIDQKAGVIHVTKKVNYSGSNKGILEDHLKSKNGLRDIPILPPLAAQLPKNRVGLVFSRNGGHIGDTAARNIWHRFLEGAGITEPITPHQMRHTYATILYEAGVDSKTAAAWMGDTETVVAKIYQELRPKQQEKEIEKVAQYFAKEA